MNEKVIIIGGGIVGTSSAYFLSKHGADVTLIDRGDEGQATNAAAGIICPWLSRRRNKAWYRMVRAGAKMYPDLIKELEKDGEHDTGYKRVGVLSLHTDEKILQERKERAIMRREEAPEIGEVELLNEAEAQEKFPLLQDGYQALYVSGAARVDGRKLRDSLLRAAKKHGTTVIQGNAELMLDNTFITAVKVNGETLAADKFIAAPGAWMNELLEPHQISEFDVRPQKAQILHLRYKELETGHLPVIMPPNDQYLLSFEDHRFVVGATHEDDVGYDTDVTVAGIQDIITKALRIAPDLEKSSIIEARVGFRPMTEGFLPVMGTLEAASNLYYVNGLGATGLTAGPFMGQQLAKLILQQPTDIDINDYKI